MATQKIIRIKLDGIILRSTYDPSRDKRFNTRGLDSLSQKKLYDLITIIRKCMRKSLLIAVDFDGTIVEDAYPKSMTKPLQLKRSNAPARWT